jgi:hypothetical protein
VFEAIDKVVASVAGGVNYRGIVLRRNIVSSKHIVVYLALSYKLLRVRCNMTVGAQMFRFKPSGLRVDFESKLLLTDCTFTTTVTVGLQSQRVTRQTQRGVRSQQRSIPILCCKLRTKGRRGAFGGKAP